MTDFLPAPTPDALSDEQAAMWEDFTSRHPGRLTNMKAVLLNDPTSFRVYMTWYDLFDELASHIGERPVHILCHAISDANDCLVCSVFFRRILIDGGDDPDNPTTTPLEDALLDFGRAFSRTPNDIPDDTYRAIETLIPDSRVRIVLVAFAGQMVATNLFNMAGRVPLDEVLYGYRRREDARVV